MNSRVYDSLPITFNHIDTVVFLCVPDRFVRSDKIKEGIVEFPKSSRINSLFPLEACRNKSIELSRFIAHSSGPLESYKKVTDSTISFQSTDLL